MTDFGAEDAFHNVAERIHRHYGIRIPSNAGRIITLRHAEKIDALDVPERLGKKCAAELIAEMDGSFVPCVKMDDTAADRRKTRETEWKEIKLCLARNVKKVDPVFSVTTKGPEEAGQLLEDAAHKAGLTRKTHVHGVGDGAPWIADQMDLHFGTQGTYLIDFYHVCEYLAAAAPTCAQNTSAWLDQQKERLKTGEVQAVLNTLAQHREPEPASEQEDTPPQPVRQAHQYLSNRRQHLDYKGALARGLPIGSGEVESAHRQVVQKRIKRPGAWWLIDNAHAMANMIAARLNGAWNSYWENLAA